MRHFIAVVHKEPDSCFGVHFPDAPGCYSAAEALDDIPEIAAEALALYFEDQELPEPRGLAALREAAAEDIAEGAFLIAVPLVPSTTKRARVTRKANMEVSSKTAASAAAKVLGNSKSGKAGKSAAASTLAQRPNKKT